MAFFTCPLRFWPWPPSPPAPALELRGPDLGRFSKPGRNAQPGKEPLPSTLDKSTPLSSGPWGQWAQCGYGWAAVGLASRGTDAKLQQPGVQQVEPVPGTASPTPGRAGLAEAPSLGHPACTALLPRLPTFPRCHPPLSPPPTRSAPGQCPGLWYKEARDAISLSSLGAQAPQVPHYRQRRRSRKVNMAPGLHQSPTPTSYRASFDPRKTGHRHSGSLELPQGTGTEPQPEAAPEAG